MGDVWERLLRDRGYRIQQTLGEGAYSKVSNNFDFCEASDFITHLYVEETARPT